MKIQSCGCAQVKSFEKYIADLVGLFDYSDFSPENSDRLYEKFESVFNKTTPYWEKSETDHSWYVIKFKKYGNNRKQVLLKFTFLPRKLLLELVDENLQSLHEKDEISFSEMWKDHAILLSKVTMLIRKGLTSAEELIT